MFGTAIVLMVGLELVVMRTRFGRAMRAVSVDAPAAALMGIPVDRVISVTFVLGSALAAAAGILVGLSNPKIDPLMGLLPGLKAFVAAVLGGIGNIPGAMVGGLLLGVVETMVSAYLSSTYRDAIAFVILIAILLYRPTGLFGTRPGREGMTHAARTRGAGSPRRSLLLVLADLRAAARAQHLLPDDPRAHPDRRARRGEPQARERLHRPVLDRPRRLHGGGRLHRRGALRVRAARRCSPTCSSGCPRSVARALYFPIPLVFGGLAAALAGLLVGIPALRLRGDYLAIATLGFGEIIRIAILNIDAVGGARGFSLAGAGGRRPALREPRRDRRASWRSRSR